MGSTIISMTLAHQLTEKKGWGEAFKFAAVVTIIGVVAVFIAITTGLLTKYPLLISSLLIFGPYFIQIKYKVWAKQTVKHTWKLLITWLIIDLLIGLIVIGLLGIVLLSGFGINMFSLIGGL